MVARALREQRVDFVFGVVGVPVVELAMALQSAGVRYVGMRNEQAVSAPRPGWPAGGTVDALASRVPRRTLVTWAWACVVTCSLLVLVLSRDLSAPLAWKDLICRFALC